jgi:hypothetical protein
MRLYEIIDFKPRKTVQTTSHDIRHDKISGISRAAGAGLMSRAYAPTSPKRLNQISKISKPGKYDDAYMAYLKMIDDFNKSGGQNPFFPRIHELKVYRDKNGEQQFHVKLEKLHPLSIFSKDHDEDLLRSLKENYFGRVLPFAAAIDRQLEGDDVVQDEDLIEACDMISLLAQRNDFLIDMHDGNVMWRITGNMPQLVITDPLIK